MGETATDLLRHRDSDLGWPLEEVWAAGELLDGRPELETGTVILMLDEPAAELPWTAEHPSGKWIAYQLRLGKRPMLWWYRPMVWPPWNALHRRVARVWTAAAGLDTTTIDALRTGAAPPVVEPTDDELRDQLTEERTLSRAHLREIVERYRDPDWRRDHRGEELDDLLWRAAAGLVEIDDALAALDA